MEAISNEDSKGKKAVGVETGVEAFVFIMLGFNVTMSFVINESVYCCFGGLNSVMQISRTVSFMYVGVCGDSHELYDVF